MTAGQSPCFSAAVLAGGFSSRMGRDKACLPFGGTTLLGFQVGKLRALGIEDIMISGSEQALTARAVSERLGINDVWQVFGALWRVKPSTLRAYFNRALTQKKSLRFQDLLKETID